MQIAQKYPDSIVEMHFNSTSIPLVAMRQDLLQVGFNGDIAMYANTPDGQVPYLLTLNVVGTFFSSSITGTFYRLFAYLAFALTLQNL